MALGVVGDLNWRLWVASGLHGTFYLRLRDTARAAKEAARVAILGYSAARNRARRRAVGEPQRRIDASGWAQWALGVVRDLNWRLWVASGLRGTFPRVWVARIGDKACYRGTRIP